MVEKAKEKSKEEIHAILMQLLFTKRSLKTLEANEEKRPSMSVLIKNKKMPKCCVVCWAAEICRYYDKFSNCERPEHCPMVEVSVPHGRLIDEDRVIDAIYERVRELQESHVFRKKHGDIDLIGVKPYITKIPTVIEAEK